MFLPTNITLQFGDSGDYVAELQRRLVQRQCMARGMITAFYDGPTVSGVRTFQIAAGLQGDGIAGPETLRRLNSYFDEDSGAPGDENEQAASVGPTLEQRMNLQILAEDRLDEKELEKQMLVAEQSQAQQMEQQLQKDHSQERTLDKQQLLQQQIDQKQQAQQTQMSQRVEHEARANDVSLAKGPAFIDKPISKTFDDLGKDKLEQDTGGQSRGPELTRDPTEGKAQKAELDVGKTGPGVSIPKDVSAEREVQPTRNTELSPNAPAVGVAASPSAPAVAPPEPAVVRAPVQAAAQSPEMSRLSQQIEAKLPPHVIEEVKEVGVVMLNQGVKQSQLPGGLAPTAPERTPGMEERQTNQGGGRGV